MRKDEIDSLAPAGARPHRVAVVTGAAGGIGSSVAARLAGSGHRVALLDLDAARLEATAQTLRAQGHHVQGWVCDVTDSEQVDAVVASLARALGPPQVLVNNAGTMRDGRVQELSDRDWYDVMDSNATGSFALCRAVVPFMVRVGGGRIVMISSRAALGNAGRVNYSAAKAAMQGMTRALALEVGPDGITVNCVAPGHITSEMTRAMAARAGLTYDEYQERAARSTSVRRVGTTDDVAEAVAHFVSPGAGYVTGQILYVAGKPTV